jgi:hypothetical protein
MKVKDLIARLSTMDPDARVEFEVPADTVPTEVYPERGGDRYPIFSMEEVFYNTPENKWVVFKNDRAHDPRDGV